MKNKRITKARHNKNCSYLTDRKIIKNELMGVYTHLKQKPRTDRWLGLDKVK